MNIPRQFVSKATLSQSVLNEAAAQFGADAGSLRPTGLVPPVPPLPEHDNLIAPSDDDVADGGAAPGDAEVRWW